MKSDKLWKVVEVTVEVKMCRVKLVRRFLSICIILITPALLLAQGTFEDYQRAEKLLPNNASKLVYKLSVTPHWIGESSKFWYRNDLRGETKEFILIDPEKNTREFAFDHEKLAAELSETTEKEYSHDKLPFNSIEFIDDETAISFTVEKQKWKCSLEDYTLEKIDSDVRKEDGESPDGKWVAFIRDYNLFIRSTKSGEEIQLSFDGEKHNEYATPLPSPVRMVQQGTMEIENWLDIMWSPDSKKLIAYRMDQRGAGQLHLIQSCPPDSGRPRLFSYAYPLPTDEVLPLATPYVFDIEKRKQIEFKTEPIELHYVGGPWWDNWFDEESNYFYFLDFQRGYSRAWIKEVNLATGDVRNLIEESSETCVDPHPMNHFFMKNGKEMIWASERSGWNMLYLYDVKTGKVKNQITRGDWFVRYISKVDEKNRQIYLAGAGKEPGRNPYFRHLYRLNFNGSKLTLLTPENADHGVTISPDFKYFIDNYSTVDTAPVTVLRRCSDGKVIRELERADIDDLLATGWRFPEEVKVKARDGKTDIYGVLYRPSTFDPQKKYACLDKIYTGPHNFFAPKSFWAYQSEANSFAELGFIVLQVDGMGTGKRSKAFHNVSYKNLGDGGIPDHIAAFEQLAEKYPYMDLNRVGIFGFSAGGYDCAHAMFNYPDFYKVGISASGNHDHRCDKTWWNELWMGYPVGLHYIQQSNFNQAHKLQGKLLITHGELDNNVNPFCTMRLANALIKANKDFDMLIVPNQFHYLHDLPWYVRIRWDYFVRNLMGVEPPKEYEIKNWNE